ncbi:hypothetical protein A6E02_04040 [Aliivibrio fischeri]|nr:hypothetical protein A6E02_04040 [Aliivibrio fischeri]
MLNGLITQPDNEINYNVNLNSFIEIDQFYVLLLLFWSYEYKPHLPFIKLMFFPHHKIKIQKRVKNHDFSFS